MHTSIAIAGLLVTGVSAFEASGITGSYTYEQFCSKFGRHGGAEEMATRKAHFYRNLAKVVTHNADKKQMYKQTINRFSDWSDEEIMKFLALSGKVDKSSLVKGLPVYNGTGKTPPNTVDYRKGNVLTPVNDQGQCGSCWAFCTVQSVESAFALKYQELTALSVSQLVECDTEDHGCDGGWPLTAMDWIKKSKGLYTAEEYPYQDGSGVAGKCQDMSGKKTSAIVTKAVAVEENSAAATMVALANKGPLSIAIAASPDWCKYHSGIFEMNTDDKWDLNHGIQLVGYGADESLNGQQYWIVRNSWGAGWGDAGFIRMWKAGEGQTEPCNADHSECGTLALLCAPAYVEVGTPEGNN